MVSCGFLEPASGEHDQILKADKKMIRESRLHQQQENRMLRCMKALAALGIGRKRP